MSHKKHVLFTLFILSVLLICALAVLPAATASAEAGSASRPERKLTLLVYMCGSNLESSQGAASADIQEMLDSKAGGKDVALLVMAGGTNHWASGYDPSRNTVIEISKGRQRIIRQTDKQDMGNGESLTDFLRLGVEKYPAQQYALILWDHGGGPLEGVCWDELFSMSHLSLPELISAIKNANLGQKLSWIGFDACLMSSLEVATALTPVADYMIASQETEPGFGWNYAFLTGIENDKSPAETGARIVDLYIHGHESSGETLTLACTDLEKADEAAKALGNYFSSAEREISADTFPVLSNLRMSSAGFGKGLRSIVNDDGYDLVDARDLVEKIPWNPEQKDQLLRLLNDAVVYSRSNQDIACGLTLYHPYSNKNKYLSDWNKRYRSMDLIHGYTKYVQSFGTLLTGAELIRWQNLQTVSNGRNQQNEYSFSLQLNKEEAAHFVSGQLLIVSNSSGESTLDKGAVLLSVSPAVLDQNGMLTGVYDQSALYAEKQDGTLVGPLSFYQTDDGKYNVVRAAYIPEKEYTYANAAQVLMYLDAADHSKHPSVIRTRVWDEATGSYSSRLTFSEEGYRMVDFIHQNLLCPEEEDGTLPDYYSWTKNSNVLSWLEFPLPDSWRFVWKEEQLTGHQLFAFFRITDSQQNVVCSLPVPVENPNHVPFVPVFADIPELNCKMTLSGYVDHSYSQSVRLKINTKNDSTEDAAFQISDLVLNGERQTDCNTYFSVPAEESILEELDIKSKDLSSLDAINSISFRLENKNMTDHPIQEVQMELSGCSLQNLAFADSMGQAEQDGILMDVLNIEPESTGGFSVTLMVHNQSDQEIYPQNLVLNDLELEIIGTCNPVSPKHSRVYDCHWQNGLSLDQSNLRIPGEKESFYYTWIVDRLLEIHHETEIKKVSLVYTRENRFDRNRGIVSAELKQPWSIREYENAGSTLAITPMYFPQEARQQTPLIPVAQTNRWNACMRRIILGESQVILVLDITNLTNDFLNFIARDLTLNHTIEKENPLISHSLSNEVFVAPASTQTIYLSLTQFDGLTAGTDVSSLSFLLYAIGDKTESSAVITLREIAAAGKAGLTWIDADQTEVTPVGFINQQNQNDEAPPETISIQERISIPDNASAYLQWINAPLTEEETALADSVNFLLIIPVNETIFVPIVRQYLEKDENGKMGTWFPGLIACTDKDETNYIPLIVAANEKKMIAETRADIDIIDFGQLKMKSFHHVRLNIDYTGNTGRISKFEADGDDLDLNSNDIIARWFPTVMETGIGKNGRFVPFEEMNETSRATAECSEEVENSLNIVLRPVSDQDGIQVLFSVRNLDGTGYSFIVPYETIYPAP